MKKYKRNKRIETQTTFEYPCEYDEKECEQFIVEYKGLAIHIAIQQLKNRNMNFGYHLAVSSALEALFKVYLTCKTQDISKDNIIKSLIRKNVSWSLWTMARINGYIPNVNKVFFPKEFVDYETFFMDRSDNKENDLYTEIDCKIIDKIIQSFSNKEYQIHQLYMSGYDFQEICSRVGGYKDNQGPFQMYRRTLDRVKTVLDKPKKRSKS